MTFMIQREQIESILRINGVPKDSPDEHIRAVLLSAKYHHDEVDTAIMVLRQNSETKATHVDGLHKVFRSDETLKPEEISRLLGIEVDASHFPTNTQLVEEGSSVNSFLVCSVSLVLIFSGIFLHMYMSGIGPFAEFAEAGS